MQRVDGDWLNDEVMNVAVEGLLQVGRAGACHTLPVLVSQGRGATSMRWQQQGAWQQMACCLCHVFDLQSLSMLLLTLLTGPGHSARSLL